MICTFFELFLLVPQSIHKEMRILKSLKKTSNKKPPK